MYGWLVVWLWFLYVYFVFVDVCFGCVWMMWEGEWCVNGCWEWWRWDDDDEMSKWNDDGIDDVEVNEMWGECDDVGRDGVVVVCVIDGVVLIGGRWGGGGGVSDGGRARRGVGGVVGKEFAREG